MVIRQSVTFWTATDKLHRVFLALQFKQALLVLLVRFLGVSSTLDWTTSGRPDSIPDVGYSNCFEGLGLARKVISLRQWAAKCGE